jgi:lipoprotein-releasing system permease protein
MSYERFIGLRYLMAKKRTQVVSIITLISVCGVALGVTALIVVLSVMGGFKKDLKDKILGTKAHAVVQAAEGDDLVDAGQVAKKAAAIEGVTGAEPFLEAEVMVSSPTNLSGVILRGIDPDRVGQVSELSEDMVEGKLKYLQNPRPMLERLDEEREQHINEILDRVGSEKDDFEEEKAGSEDKGAARADDQPDGVTADDDAFDMPPLPHQESAEQQAAGEEGDDEGEMIMPPIAEEEDGEGAMPPIFGDGEAEGDDESRQEEGPDYEALPGLVIGPELKKSLQVELGSEVNVVTPEGEMGPTGLMPRSRPFRIVGIFKTGMYEYDANYAYTSFSDAKDFLNRKGASGVEIKTIDANLAIEIAADLQKSLGPKYEVLDWQEMNRSLFYALELEKIAMFVVLTFIILVASFSIIAMLIMIVIEKARDIAILKSMGVPDGGIRRIFVFQGLVIGGLGALIGLVGGLGICAYLSVYGVPLDSEVYYISKLPVEVNAWEVGAVIVCALFISWAATIYPAYLASKLRPVDGLRYD